MRDLARICAALLLATTLASCASSSQSGGAAPPMPIEQSPQSVPANPPSDSLPKRPPGGRMHQRDQIGGGVGKNLMVNLGDVALPNASKIQSVNLGIDAITVTDLSGNVTTVAQYTSPQVVNVLAYQAGSTTPIAAGNVATTTYASLTIVVDTSTSNYVGAAGGVHPLTFSNQTDQSTSGFGASTVTTSPGPTAGSVAITFNQPFQVVGSGVDLDVDYNAMESLYPNGGVGVSRPSLSVAQYGYEGAISGNVTNASGGAVTNAVIAAVASNGSVAATGVTDANGNFLLHTLVAGTYQLQLYNQYTGAAGWNVNASNQTPGNPAGPMTGPSVTVAPGQTNAVGTLAD